MDRFIVAPWGLTDPPESPDLVMVLLVDWSWFSEHDQALERWCKDHDAQQQGMTVIMPRDVLTLFALRWS